MPRVTKIGGEANNVIHLGNFIFHSPLCMSHVVNSLLKNPPFPIDKVRANEISREIASKCPFIRNYGLLGLLLVPATFMPEMFAYFG